MLAPIASATTLASKAAALREAAEALAGEGAWKGAAGRQVAELVAAIEQDGDAQALKPAEGETPALWQGLMDGSSVRPSYGGHPRLTIWGLLEARLQQADLMVLGGLNEGVWPAAPTPDPWLAPRLRRELGLPPLDYRIGLAAHDLMSALGAPRVLLTRARRDGSSPTVASRLWLRLEAMTGGMTREKDIPGLVAAVDAAGTMLPAPRPAPAPPAKDRPREIYVTNVDRLKADPFAYYAKAMLGLRALDPIEAEHHAAWKGTAVHKVLEDWFNEDACAPDRLLERARTMIEEDSIHPMLRALWRPRLMEAIEWISAEVAIDAAHGRKPFRSEIDGGIHFAGVDLRGQADRLDQNGGLYILDYKTGHPPSISAVEEGFALQLSLLGLIAERGGFDGRKYDVAGLEYWSLAKPQGGDSQGYRRRAAKLPVDELISKMASEFEGLASKYLTGSEPFIAMLHPEHAPYGEYDQLMRRDEWYGRS